MSNYQKLLKNPIYTGLMLYNGEIHEGKHEPIISKKLFDSVQEVMMRKSKPHSKGLKPFLYRGFFRCGECGCFITTETQKGHNYLRCTKRKNPCSQKYTREEIITSEIQKEIKKVSLPDDWASWMLVENRKDILSEAQSSTLFADKTKADISLLDSKIEKLMNAYLENALSLDEYRDMKNKLVNEKQLLKEKLSAFEQKANNRFELTEKFLKYNMELANECTNEEKLHLYKKAGSNFQIKDRTVFFEPRGAWKNLLNSGIFGGNAFVSALRADPISASDSDFQFWRRGRDSNSRWVSPRRFSRPLPSTTRSPLRDSDILSEVELSVEWLPGDNCDEERLTGNGPNSSGASIDRRACRVDIVDQEGRTIDRLVDPKCSRLALGPLNFTRPSLRQGSLTHE